MVRALKKKVRKLHKRSLKKAKKFYVTTAIDYPNAPPHIGHSLEKIQADVLARWHRLKGESVFFLTGTDEHGQKVEQAAKDLGIKPEEFVDRIAPQFKDAWVKLNLSFNKFIRTTEPAHIEAAIKLIKRVAKKGDFYKGVYEGFYCVGCERFYTERELENGACPIHKRKCEIVKEESYFFRLSKYQKKLLKLYKENPEFISPKHRRAEIVKRVKEGLRDISVTRRRVKWGIPFPLDKNYTTYVWFDALPNYITALGWPRGKLFKKFWPADVHCVGKDIAWFHCVIWPAILMSAGLKLPKTVFVHGFITVEGNKISKSLGNVIDPRNLVEKYGADSVRYFLLREIPSSEDGDFSERGLIERHNSELADQLGNLVNRALVLTEKSFDSIIPKPSGKEAEADLQLKGACLEAPEKVEELVSEFRFHHALDRIWKLVESANAYVNATEPWKQGTERKKTILYNLLESLRFIAVLCEPFIPETSRKIIEQLGLNEKDFRLSKLRKFGGLKSGTKVKRGPVLFKKIQTLPEISSINLAPKVKQKEGKAVKTEVTIDDFAKLDICVGKVERAKAVEGSDKLIKMDVDVGEEKKQIVAGIRPQYKPEELVGKLIIVLKNLKPREIKKFGIVSEGMLLAAESGKDVVLLTTDKPIKPGSRVC